VGQKIRCHWGKDGIPLKSGRVKWSGLMMWSGVEWSGLMKWSGVEWSGLMKWSGLAKWSGLKKKWSRVESSGVIE
jgi:hypothetical protein